MLVSSMCCHQITKDTQMVASTEQECTVCKSVSSCPLHANSFGEGTRSEITDQSVIVLTALCFIGCCHWQVAIPCLLEMTAATPFARPSSIGCFGFAFDAVPSGVYLWRGIRVIWSKQHHVVATVLPQCNG